jgi:hypothetical protein
MFVKVLFPAKRGTLRLPFAMPLLATALLFLFSVQASFAQFSITATEVETWTTPVPVSSD